MQELDFPITKIREGTTEVFVPDLDEFSEKPSDYAPSLSPVFFNPVMELNRDLAVCAVQVFQSEKGYPLTICEPLAGCGIRGVRLAKEVEGVAKVVINDLNSKAYALASRNVSVNRLEGVVEVCNEDANFLLSRHARRGSRFDVVDLDPFGSPTPYLDSAIRALKSGGLLCATATDTAVLCGVHPEVCVRKYGGKPLRTEYCHELAVRLLTSSLSFAVARHEFGIRVLFSHSTDHYVRVYASVQRGAERANESVAKTGYVLHCFSCLHRESVLGIAGFLKNRCGECGGKLCVAGPLWLGELFDEGYCRGMAREARKLELEKKRRLLRILDTILTEVGGPPTYYVTDKICDKFNLPSPPKKRVIQKLSERGYTATPTHFNHKGVRTDAPAKVMKEVITELAGA